jgi:sugar/nucleoside kinase (ribokinase family)
MGARIAAVGEITEDLYLPDGPALLGGISVNFARTAASLGAEVTLYAPLGDDPRGDRLAALLSETSLCLRVKRIAGGSAQQRITLRGGERVFSGFDPGVLPAYRLDEDELAELAAFDAVAVPCSPESRGVFEQLAGRRGALLADFSQESPPGSGDAAAWIAPWRERLRVAFVGGSITMIEPLRELSRTMTAPVVLTVGPAGAYAFAAGEAWHEPTRAAHVVDTTGCGDAFQAGFSVCFLAGRSPAEALVAGAEAAARVAERLGGDPSALLRSMA